MDHSPLALAELRAERFDDRGLLRAGSLGGLRHVDGALDMDARRIADGRALAAKCLEVLRIHD